MENYSFQPNDFHRDNEGEHDTPHGNGCSGKGEYLPGSLEQWEPKIINCCKTMLHTTVHLSNGLLSESCLHSSLDQWAIPCLCQELYYRTRECYMDLWGLEQVLIAAMDQTEVTQLPAIYENDSTLRKMLEKRYNTMPEGQRPTYTPPGMLMDLDDLFEPTEYKSPTDKLRRLLLDLDCRRTKLCIRQFIISAKDDELTQAFLIRILMRIKRICSGTKERIIQEKLTQLYFEILHSYGGLLGPTIVKRYVVDFSDFIYYMTNEYPAKEVRERYNRKLAMMQMELNAMTLPPGASRSAHYLPPATSLLPPTAGNLTPYNDSTDGPKPQQQPPAMDKATRFLQEANRLGFSQLPLIVKLGSETKTKQLVELMLDCPAHAAAMLEFLGFRQWIAQKIIPGYSKTQFSMWCTKHVMHKEHGNAFKHYLLSVNLTENDRHKSAYKYKAWEYQSKVEEEYQRIARK